MQSNQYFVFNFDNLVAPQIHSHNFNSTILRASGAQPSKEAPGISASVISKQLLEAINCNTSYICISKIINFTWPQSKWWVVGYHSF